VRCSRQPRGRLLFLSPSPLSLPYVLLKMGNKKERPLGVGPGSRSCPRYGSAGHSSPPSIAGPFPSLFFSFFPFEPKKATGLKRSLSGFMVAPPAAGSSLHAHGSDLPDHQSP